MNTSTKAILITSGALVGTGIILCGIGYAVSGLSFMGTSNVEYERKEMVITESFSNLNLSEVSDDVTIVPSADDTVRIEYYDSNIMYHDIEVSGNTLTVELKNTNGNNHWWNHISFNLFTDDEDEHGTTLYLPEDEYGQINVSTVSGDVQIPDGYQFSSMNFNTVSGNISNDAAASGSVSVGTTSGEVRLVCGSITGLEIGTISGDITILRTDVDGTLNISTTSGSVDLDSVTASRGNIDAVSGSVRLTDFGTSGTSINTVSGDITGNLIGDYDFSTDTVSGDISLPATVSGSPLIDIETVSGDISLR